jgi:hypothetical protein
MNFRRNIRTTRRRNVIDGHQWFIMDS